MSKGARFLLAVLALAGTAACGHPEQKIVDQYFNAVNTQDTQTLQSFAAVNFDKKVDKWQVKQTVSEEKGPAPLADLQTKAGDADKAITTNKKARDTYNLEHYSELQGVKEARDKGQPVPAKFAEAARFWDDNKAKELELKKAATAAHEAADKERRIVVKSVGDLPDLDTLNGEVTSKKLLVTLIVGGQSQDYVMTLRKYDLKNATGGNVMSRWVVQSLVPAT